MNELQEQLKALQNENLALYDELTTLHQQKNNKESNESEDDLSDTKNIKVDYDDTAEQKPENIEKQIELLVDEQKKEEISRSNAQKNLQEIMQKIKSLQEKIDQQNLNMQRNLLPQLEKEEASLQDYFNHLIECCENHPNLDVNKLKDLVNEFTAKSKEVYAEKEEIEKLKHLIQYNEPHYSSNNEETPEEDGFENPLPCFSCEPPTLKEARARRRVSFNIQ